MDKFEELNVLSRPLYEWLKDNYNPHTKIIIAMDSIKVASDEMRIPLEFD